MIIDEEGFFSEEEETELMICNIDPISNNDRKSRRTNIPLYKPLSIYQNVKLFHYPSELDRINNYELET